MAAGKNLLSRVPNHFVKTITFTGASGLGLINVDVPVGTITGRILIKELAIFCSSTMVGATATIQFGTTLSSNAIIVATTVTDIDNRDFWRDTTPESQISTAIRDLVAEGILVYEPQVATITGGVLELSCFWLPLSVDGNLA
jgi:hypothetical protein